MTICKAMVKEPNYAFKAKKWGMCRCEHYSVKSYIRQATR
jgi:hypothetical protein